MKVIEAPEAVVLSPRVWPLFAEECWWVLGPEKQIEAHRQSPGEQFAGHAVHGPGGTLTRAAVPRLTDELDRRFAARTECQK